MNFKSLNLDHKVACHKHPNKYIEYFCQQQNCSQNLFCSACVFKKTTCNHHDELKDIGEFLYEQKQIFEMKGIPKDQAIHNYIITKKQREIDYKDLTQHEYLKFEQQCDQLVQKVVKCINKLKLKIQQQFEEYNQNYLKNSNILSDEILRNFQQTFVSQFQKFDDIFQQFDISQYAGLKLLLDNLQQDQNKKQNTEIIRKQYNQIIQLEQTLPIFDSNNFEEINSQFDIFQDHLNQQSHGLITIEDKPINQYDNFQKPQDKVNQELQISLIDLRKISCSANFNSNHNDTVYCIQNINTKKFATGSDDGCIRIWDTVQMDCLAILKGHQQGIRSLQILSNGYLASASFDKTIKIWNLNNLQENQQKSQYQNTSPFLVKTLKGHLAPVLALKSIPNMGLVSSSSDFTIKVWDVQDNQVLKTLSGHLNDVLCLTSTSDGNTIVSGSSDKTLRSWNLKKKFSNACTQIFKGHDDFVWCVEICPDQKTVISGSVDKTVKIWNLENGHLIQTMLGSNSTITQISYYCENILLSSNGDGYLMLWDITLSTPIHTLEGHKGATYGFQIQQDHSIISIGQDRNIMVWE
ncbi:WD40-repeat-containing domain [Pseudocohnilembus persalinus]|uniref:WD40-repeat-containing domain n=1 Tax=Pseudocohnilembus persalinus TaxID=266149 RepID=A0A0V0Q956_PSEPJ|nr:WD40-repeat-containing domain [Pseudocohnilembus persalinus]|eukprot:KRW98726.1 WD40-repeat-containing domain [Pseudocohnilembus persalinus]